MSTPRSALAVPARDPLAVLECIDRLTVGPVNLEAARLTMPYVVERGGQRTEHKLVYRYETDLFDPSNPADVNLASLIGVQVALNYGLFCSEMVFVGPWDRHDRRFIEQYTAHTAREIFAVKFVESNPFLAKEVKNLPAERRDTWLRARLRFEGKRPPRSAPAWPAADPSKHAVLSSGGKDSLLCYGLLAEAGRDVHPVFVNESGRHWFTALNAYRHLGAHEPNTARVWTNADRIFSAMLQHLPFVRKDWHRIRADIYPVRLWTVAVFLFGALPVLRSRNIGHLHIGSEFDTSERSRRGGVTHYNGLFDQSRWFDQALSRWFQRKGWNLWQYSLLRPLSELLILKILAQRYPELQAQQVSCHAAHKDGDRIRPCGRCEKCRRVVSMLVALEASPANCGYDEGQVERCLDELQARGVHQESEAAEHLEYLLVTSGKLDRQNTVRPRAEVMQVRIDPTRSPPQSVPRTVRKALFQIFSHHAEGAVRRIGKRWVPVGFDSQELLQPPYFLEPTQTAGGSAADPSESSVLWGDMTWPVAKERLQQTGLALLPVGAIEQHGPHLPLDVDAYDAERLAREVAEACSHPRPLVLPLIAYGVSYHHDDFAGTVSVGPDILSQLVYQVGMSLSRQGIDKLVIINGHGGNDPALHFAAQMINRDAGIFTCVDTGETSDTDVDSMSSTHNDVHAGEIETSTTLALRPEVVRTDRLAPAVPRFSSHYLDFTSKRGVGWYGHTLRISPSGVMGDPTLASAEKGRRMWAVIVRNLVEMIEDIKELSLEEIHQRRY
ncbi:MAG: creatininase family protein [Xanthomonadales bacterium]|jgi:creatinine amidohydrolase/Fe(II)-dependent formamide hydrolase-like protein|nr:creatininase family protein [Xanthomonadales bacterium]